MPGNNRVIIRAAGQTDIGKIREENEDCIYLDKKNRFFLVADGVGGKETGELASLSACNYIYVQFEALYSSIGEKTSFSEVSERIKKIVKDSSKYVRDISFTEAKEGMGTTITGVFFWKNNAWVFNVGDSRCYYFNGSKWNQVTKDDSLIQTLIDKGLLNNEQQKHFPYKNVITQAIGLTDPITVQVYRFKISPNDFFLLSSDGFHGLVSDKKWQKKYTSPFTSRSVDKLIDSYLKMALKAGGTDNISIIGIVVRR